MLASALGSALSQVVLVASSTARRSFSVRSVATSTARPKRFLVEPLDAHGRPGPHRFVFVNVLATPRGVRRSNVSQSYVLLRNIFRHCASNPLPLFSSNFPLGSFNFVTTILDSRLHRCLEIPLNTHNLLNMRCVTLASVETVAARKRQVWTVRIRMRAADDTHNQASYEPKE